MKIIQKKIRDLDSFSYHTKHLQIINQFLPTVMTSKEVEVLAAFLVIKGDIVKQDRFGTTARKMVMSRLGLTPGGLGNYLKALKEKGVIYKNDFNVLVVREAILPEENSQGYQFKLIKADEV